LVDGAAESHPACGTVLGGKKKKAGMVRVGLRGLSITIVTQGRPREFPRQGAA